MHQTVLALHVISVVCWFAGLFYIFRLFVYHRQHSQNESLCAVFQTMERRLLKAITVPASVMTLLSGGWLVSLRPEFLTQRWFLSKMALVFFLLCYQALAWRTLIRFRDGNYDLSEKACRMINEIPTLILIGAVLLVMFKP